jgi:tRNA-splicing ligase RtcB
MKNSKTTDCFTTENKKDYVFIDQTEAVSLLKSTKYPEHRPVTVIATRPIRDSLDETCIQQAINANRAPGVEKLILNPDAHGGYGAPIGSVLVSPTHIYPGPVGVDIKCSMSLLQMELPAEELKDSKLCQKLIKLISTNLPSGMKKGQESPACKSRNITISLADRIVTEGATKEICSALRIPEEWILRCEDAFHRGHDNSSSALIKRLDYLKKTSLKNYDSKMGQFATYGGGNHFGEANIVSVAGNDMARTIARQFKLIDGNVAFLSHCGSRGFGHDLAKNQFQLLLEKFRKWAIPLPGDDKEMVYAPVNTLEANDYLDDMALGSNFSTINHLLINSVLLECFQKVIPGVKGHLVYYISHNIARQEVINGKLTWVHRKGATRAWPAGHHGLRDTPFYETGHPILLPGDPVSGSKVMVAAEGSSLSCYSINHGAGRAMGRNEAKRQLRQKDVDDKFREMNILSNHEKYPVDEAPDSYKDFNEVTKTIEIAGLATTVADLKARFVIKGD